MTSLYPLKPPVLKGSIAKVYKSESAMQQIYAHFNQQLIGWPVDVNTGFIHNAFGDTFYMQCGDKLLPPLVLLHGLGVNSTSFKRVVKALCQKYCVYLLDFPGSAGFSKPASQLMKDNEVASWLVSSLQALDERKIHLVGVSFGAWIAAKSTLEYPQSLASVHLISPPALSGKAKLSFTQLLKLIWLGLRLNRPNAFKLCQMLCARGNLPPLDTVESVFLCLSGSRSFKESGHKLDKQQCQQMNVPLQLIVGEEENLCDVASIAEYFPDAEVSGIDNAGHFVIEEQTDKVVELLVTMIEQINRNVSLQKTG